MPRYNGDSVAKWEGDELEATTTGFDDRAWIDQYGFPPLARHGCDGAPPVLMRPMIALHASLGLGLTDNLDSQPLEIASRRGYFVAGFAAASMMAFSAGMSFNSGALLLNVRI